MDQVTSDFLDEFMAPVAKKRDVLTLDLTGLEQEIASAARNARAARKPVTIHMNR